MNVTACNKQAEGHFIRQEGRELAGDTGTASVRKESHRPKANTEVTSSGKKWGRGPSCRQGANAPIAPSYRSATTRFIRFTKM